VGGLSRGVRGGVVGKVMDRRRLREIELDKLRSSRLD